MAVRFSAHPYSLKWRRISSHSLTEFESIINEDERFIVIWTPEAQTLQQWRLYIESKSYGQRALLHAHPTLARARTAAKIHLQGRERRS